MLNNRSAIILSVAFLFIAAVSLFSFVQEIPKKPEEGRFTPVALTQPGDLDEPNTFEVLKKWSCSYQRAERCC